MIPLMKNAFLREEETKRALADFIVKTEKLSMGSKCEEFEKAFAVKQGRQDAVLFNSGGSANLALLAALGNLGWLAPRSQIGFSAVTWSTNVAPIIQLGYQPFPIDCSPRTLNMMSFNLLERLKEVKIQALFLTNVLGFVGDIEKIREICQDKKIILLEDNCESLGTETPDGRAGNFSLAATFSFFVAHHLSTIEGGMVCTDNDDLAAMLRIVRANGWDRNLSAQQQLHWRQKFNIDSEFDAKYTFYDLGFNLRPTEITGFLGLYQLQFLDDNINTRFNNYQAVEEAIKQNNDLVLLQRNHLSRLSTFALPIVCHTPELRRKYLNKFLAADIEVRPLIAGNIQRQPFWGKYVQQRFVLPGADFLHNNAFYCGNYPELTAADLMTIKSCLVN